MGWGDWERTPGEEGDMLHGDRLALACFALILLLGLFSIGQSVLMGLGQ